MMIKIEYIPSKNHYSWKLYTGPDGSDEYSGNSFSLGQCFEEIIKQEIFNSQGYK